MMKKLFALFAVSEFFLIRASAKGLVVMLCGGAACSQAAVKVSSFGFDSRDSTRFIQAALDSGAETVLFDKQSGPWVAKPLFARSNTEIVFEEGVELVAKRGEFKLVQGDTLLSLDAVTNVTLRGQGKGATMRMWKADYQSASYEPSEWRHALNIRSSKDILVENMSFVSSGGDGIYLGVKVSGCANTDVTIRNCVCDDNHRQGISVISAENLLIENVVMKNTSGTAPQSGIDFEPNSWNEKLVNCVMRNCTTLNNAGAGYDMYFGSFDARTAPVSIELENCKSIGDTRPSLPLTFRGDWQAKGLPQGGYLKVRGCHFKDCKSNAVVIQNKPLGVMDATFEDCVFECCPVATPDAPNVRLFTSSRDLPPTDGVAFRGVTIVRGGSGEWLEATKRPWMEKGVEAIGGDVRVAACRTETLDAAWCAERFPSCGQRLNLNTVAFDPAKVSAVVDSTPGARAKLTQMKIRFAVDAVAYARQAGPVAFVARVSTVNAQPLAGKPFEVTDMKTGRKLATLAAPDENAKEFSFEAPAAGYYRISCEVKPHAIVFTECNAPIGFLPSYESKLDVYKSSGNVWFWHGAGEDAAFFCGGGIGEYVTVNLTDPLGADAGKWTNVGDWGFRRLAPDDPSGLWRIGVSRPAQGFCWEDSYLDMTGAPAVFFLSNEKYWR